MHRESGVGILGSGAHRSGEKSVRQTVRTLVGHGQIGLAAKCLGSLVKYYDQPVCVIVHDDGTLTEEDINQFRTSVPNSTFVLKGEADPVVNEFLGSYPACRRFRDHSAYALKLFDVQILEEGPELSFMDSDVMILRPVTNLFQLPSEPSAGGIFMRNPTQAYSVTLFQFVSNVKLRLADKLNSGLLHFRRSAFDWDLVEWFLQHDKYVVHPYWKEQTVWSALAAATHCWCWDEGQVRVITKRNDVTAQVVVAHYVSSFRGLVDNAPTGGREWERPVFVPIAPFGECSRWRFAADYAGRILPGIRRRMNSFGRKEFGKRSSAPSSDSSST